MGRGNMVMAQEPLKKHCGTGYVAMDQYLLYNTIFRGMNYFDVNRRGTIGFDTAMYFVGISIRNQQLFWGELECTRLLTQRVI